MEIVINSEAIAINPLLSGPVGIIWGSSLQLSPSLSLLEINKNFIRNSFRRTFEWADGWLDGRDVVSVVKTINFMVQSWLVIAVELKSISISIWSALRAGTKLDTSPHLFQPNNYTYSWRCIYIIFDDNQFLAYFARALRIFFLFSLDGNGDGDDDGDVSDVSGSEARDEPSGFEIKTCFQFRQIIPKTILDEEALRMEESSPRPNPKPKPSHLEQCYNNHFESDLCDRRKKHTSH